jgi:hypothetical protein
MEKTTPAMVIIDPAIIPSTEFAPSAAPVNVQPQVLSSQFVTGLSKATLTTANNIAAMAMIVGMNHKLERTRSQYLKISDLIAIAPHSLFHFSTHSTDIQIQLF